MLKSLRRNYIEKYSFADRSISQAIVSVYFLLVMLNVYRVVEPEFSLTLYQMSKILAALEILFVIRASWSIVRLANYKQVIFTMICFLVIAVNLLMFPATEVYFKNNVESFLLRPFLVTLLLMANFNKECLVDSFSFGTKISSLAVLLLNLFYLTRINPDNYELSYFMGLSNALIFPTVFLLFDILKKKRRGIFIVNLALIISNLLFILLKGSRGALLTIAIGFVILFLKMEGNSIITWIGGILIVLFFFLWKPILLVISKISAYYGIESRTISQLLQNATYGSSRNIIQQNLLKILSENPFVIRGINADYIVNGIYAHNFFLEALYDLGLILGVALIAVVVWCAVVLIKRKCAEDYEYLILMFLLSSFPLLMLSSSFWVETSFWPWVIITALGMHKKAENEC